MKSWLRRIRGAVGMGLTWAVGWGLVGGLIELTWNVWPGFPLGPLVDMWPQVLAIPGFLGGVAFSTVLRIAEGRRRFDELSLPRFAGWGALGGVLLSALITTVVGFAPWSLVVAGIVTLLCAGSAAGSLALARMGEDRQLPGSRADVAGGGLTGGEPQDLLGGGG